MKNSTLGAAVSSLCLWHSHCASAETPLPAQAGALAAAGLQEVIVTGEKTADDYNAEQSSVAAKMPAPLRDIPQTVTVIDRAVLDAQNATSLVEALRNVPGITLSAGEGGQIGNNINLRGFSARTDIYLDGFRDRGQYQRDVFSLDAVEVLEGSSSLLFGRGSTGGVINQVSKHAQLTPIGEVDLSLGTDDYYRTTIDVGHAIDATSAFRIAAMSQSVDATRDVANRRDWGIAPSLAFGIGTPTEVTLSVLSQHNHDIPDYGFPLLRLQGELAATPIDAPHDRYYGYTNDKFDQNVNVFNVSFKHHFNPALMLRSNTQYSQYRIDAAATPLGGLVSYDAASNAYSALTSTTVPAGTPLEQLLIAVQQRDRSISDSSLFNQTDLLLKLHTAGLAHHLAAGTEIGRDAYHNDYYGWYNFNYNNGAGLSSSANATTGNVAVFNLGAPPYSAKPSGANVYRVPSNVTQTSATTLAAYVNDQLDLGRYFKLVAGLRWDQFSADQSYLNYAYNGLITSNPTPATAATVAAANAAVLGNPVLSYYTSNHIDRMLSTRAGLIWQPSAAQSYYVSYGTSFDPLAEAVAGLPTTGAAATQFANASDPEKNRSYETGAKWDLLQRRLSFDAALFQIEKTNARTLDPVTSLYTLDGDIRVRGGELKWVGHLLAHWQVIGGYTWLDGKILRSPVVGNQGSVPQQTPRHSATLWSTYDFLSVWQVGGGATYSSTVWTNNTQTAQVPGYVRFDAMLAWRHPSWDLRLNLQNLTDKTYFQAISGGRATPADGFRAVVTASYHL